MVFIFAKIVNSCNLFYAVNVIRVILQTIPPYISTFMTNSKYASRIFVFISAVAVFLMIFNGFLKAQLKNAEPDNIIDYKVLNSNESFIEIEFSPNYTNEIDFQNSIGNSKQYGIPDVKFRSFPLYFPSENNPRVEIVDSKSEDVQNVDVKPVPTFKKSKEKGILVPQFDKDDKAYESNSFYPSNFIAINKSGSLRNRYFGYLNFYPVQYNPVLNTIRKYSYVRIRITFQGSPIYSKKSLSREERSFLQNSALNSDIAANWSNQPAGTESSSGIQNSVLASGDFYKIEVRETGIYKVDKNFLSGAGINVNGINPRTIKIYGNGGSELPYNNSIPAPFDLVENKIFVSGQEDGQFNDNDYILFFGKNPNEWTYDTLKKTYFHNLNNYSRVNYYWITFGGAEGLRMELSQSPNQPGLSPLASFKDRLFEEPEINNLGSTGYLWVSQSIGVNESFTFNKELKGYIDESLLNLRFRFGNGSSELEVWRLEDLNSNYLINQVVFYLTGYSHINLDYIGDDPYSPMGVNYRLLPGRRNINFRASLPSQSGNSSNVRGYYDYLEVLYDRNFSADNNVLRFNSPDTNSVVEFSVGNFTSNEIKIFDVTQQENVGMIQPISNSNGTIRFQSNISSRNPKEFYAIGGGNYMTPLGISSRVSNQNLKGENAAGCGFIIISPKEFLSAANRLKAQREIPGTNYIKTIVVDVEKIYNEFSGGLQDPVAMRNFLKYAYYNWEERPVYVLFFGDGSYDYKNIYNLYSSGLKNWIPPIQVNSDFADDVASYCSDDYIVEINESQNEPNSNIVTDFSSGRVCVNNTDEANDVVDKIINYEGPANFGKWKNEAMYIADDGWTTENVNGDEQSQHTDQCERLAELHSPQFLKKNKVYIVSYPTEWTPQGRRKPLANEDIIANWNAGQLVINYTGHGSTDLWAHEHIFERQVSIPQLSNNNKYPFVSIASCDLARWDDPFNISAAEELINVRNKGAIAISAATRAVYSAPNEYYNNSLYDNLFTIDTLNLCLRMGKAVFNVKQSLFSDNDLKFALLGDPTIRLGTPQHRTRVDSINGHSANELFEMKALQRVRISGSILRTDSTEWSDYNGSIDLSIHDVDKNISLLDFNYPFNFKLLGGIIFTGRAEVVNGKWSLQFVVPRDISYNPGRGKIISYFKNSATEGLGFSNNFIMSGLDSTAAPDSTGPEVKIYMDSRNFRTGDIVNQNPKLIADFNDENGLNLTGTIGHKIEATINDNDNNKIDLTPFYTSGSGFQTGTVEYPMHNLANGKYKLEIKAWDTYNNFSVSDISFEVSNNSELSMDNVYNYPNPMKDQTTFIFQHNSDEPMEAEIKIYTVSGRLIRELNKTNITDKFVNIDWDGKDSDGDYIANGTYIYKVVLKSENGNFSKSTTGKLAMLK